MFQQSNLECHLLTSESRHIPCVVLGKLTVNEEVKTVIEVDTTWYGIPDNIISSSRKSSFRLIFSLTRQQGFMHNLKLEGRIMFKYNLQRSDLVYVAVRYRSVSSNLGRGLFAKVDIPADTIIAFYPGPFRSKKELQSISSQREEGDRYVFALSATNFIDGTDETDQLIIFANDAKDSDSNCKAYMLRFDRFEQSRPIIVTKRRIYKDEELTYCYGDAKLEWRQNKPCITSEPFTDLSSKEPTAKPKKKYQTGSKIRYTPHSGNKVGCNLPFVRDREHIAKAIMKHIQLPEEFKTTTKRPKGSIDKGYHCPQCFGCFSSLRKHPNCKGQASDGGIVSKRKLRFCPICPGFMRIVAELVPHLTRVHRIDRATSRSISSRYRKYITMYQSGELQKTEDWPDTNFAILEPRFTRFPNDETDESDEGETSSAVEVVSPSESSSVAR